MHHERERAAQLRRPTGGATGRDGRPYPIIIGGISVINSNVYLDLFSLSPRILGFYLKICFFLFGLLVVDYLILSFAIKF